MVGIDDKTLLTVGVSSRNFAWEGGGHQATLSATSKSLKLVKTRLKNRLCDETLDKAMRVNCEGPETLMDEYLY